VPYTVTTEQLQHYIATIMVCFRHVIVNTLRKCDDVAADDDDNNNNNNTLKMYTNPQQCGGHYTH
jgi:hypothetical protein